MDSIVTAAVRSPMDLLYGTRQGIDRATPEPPKRWYPNGAVTDTDIIDHIGDIDPLTSKVAKFDGVIFFAQSAVMIDQNSPTNKEYRGYIGVQEGEAGQKLFVGGTAWGRGGLVVNGGGQGKVQYMGLSLSGAISAVNAMLDEKSGKYTVDPNTGPSRLSLGDVHQQFVDRVRT